MKTRPDHAIVQLSKVRLKEPLRAALERTAADRGVTMNAEIARRLEQSFRDDRIAARLANIERRLVPLDPNHGAVMTPPLRDAKCLRARNLCIRHALQDGVPLEDVARRWGLTPLTAKKYASCAS